MADFVIVGQGLAGTALAWQLRWRGARVLVLDREPPTSASRVAAGLITPVTGLRLVPSWRLRELLPAAADHYLRVERETAVPCFVPRPSVRIFQDAAERSLFEKKFASSLAGLARLITDPINPQAFDTPSGALEMPDAARLDVTAYLDASRNVFASDGSYRRFTLDPARDVVPTADGVRLPELGLTVHAVVFCQGHSDNPWFPHIRFQSARGDVLTLHIPGLALDRVVHRGVWLAPLGDDCFLAGSTFDRTALVNEPSPHGREEICDRLRRFLKCRFEVIDHRAAVRPIIDINRPTLLRHAVHAGLVFFNGLGSKGALAAPRFAGRLAGSLLAGEAVDPADC